MIIGESRRDLGLSGVPGHGYWKRRSPDDIAALCARAAGPAWATNKAAAGPAVEMGAVGDAETGVCEEGGLRLVAWPSGG